MVHLKRNDTHEHEDNYAYILSMSSFVFCKCCFSLLTETIINNINEYKLPFCNPKC